VDVRRGEDIDSPPARPRDIEHNGLELGDVRAIDGAASHPAELPVPRPMTSARVGCGCRIAPTAPA
jgi:hypothetical protein